MEVTMKAIHFDANVKLEEFIQKRVVKLEQYSDRKSTQHFPSAVPRHTYLQPSAVAQQPGQFCKNA